MLIKVSLIPPQLILYGAAINVMDSWRNLALKDLSTFDRGYRLILDFEYK